MRGGNERFMQMRHLTVFVIPVCILWLDGNNTAFYVVDIVFVLTQRQTDNGQIDLAVDTLRVKSFLQHDTRLVTDLNGLLYRLGDRFDRLFVGHLLGGLHVTHHHAEDGEGNPQQGKTMPIAMMAMPKPWGSSRLNFSTFDSLTMVWFGISGVTRSADFTSQSFDVPLLAMRAYDWSAANTGTVTESMSCVALPL